MQIVHLLIVLLVAAALSLLLVQDYEAFRLIKHPRRDEVFYRTCERGQVATGKHTCCPEDQYDLETGQCNANECTTNTKHWLQIPICRQSNKGIIQSYGESISDITENFNGGAVTPAAANSADLTMGEYLSTAHLDKLSLCGGEGLPCTKLRLNEPVPDLSMYKDMLITLKGSSPSGTLTEAGFSLLHGTQSFGFYIHQDKPYLVQPLEMFNEYEHVALPLESSTWTQLQYNGKSLPMQPVSSGWERIEDQSWYDRFNPLMQYDGKLIRREDQLTGMGAWAYIADGKPYALWGKDCNLQDVQPITIDANNPVLALLPTGSTFHHFSLAYKQPWFKDLLPECQLNQQVLSHF